MYKAAVIGDSSSVSGFAALGLTVFAVSEPEEAAELIKKTASGGFAVIYITEALAAALEQELEKYGESSIPAIIPIPGIYGNTGIGMAQVSKSVERAVGSDIFSDKK